MAAVFSFNVTTVYFFVLHCEKFHVKYHICVCVEYLTHHINIMSVGIQKKHELGLL